MIRKGLTLFLLLFMAFPALAQSQNQSSAAVAGSDQLYFPTEVPTSVNGETWIYKVVKNIFFDVDDVLKESGIEIDFCTYQNQRTQVPLSYKKMGNCLFAHFLDSMKVKGQAGVIYFWMKDAQKKLVPIRVDWRPTDEGWRGVFRELWALESESLSKFWIKIRGSSQEQLVPTKFKKNFLGRITLSFPPGTDLTSTFLEKNAVNFILKLDKAQEISFEVNPVGKKNGEVQYQGQVLLSQEAHLSLSGDVMVLDFSTNINVLKTDRTYRMTGKMRSDTAPKKAEALP